jgi:hypothetical protein
VSSIRYREFRLQMLGLQTIQQTQTSGHSIYHKASLVRSTEDTASPHTPSADMPRVIKADLLDFGQPNRHPSHTYAKQYKKAGARDLSILYGPAGSLHFAAHKNAFVNSGRWFKHRFQMDNLTLSITLVGDDPIALEAFFEFSLGY